MASTRGGERALQHIRLIKSDGSAVVVGHANPAQGTAELHTLGHVLALSKQRFGRELAIPPVEYVHFLELATKVLESFGMTVAVVAYARADGQTVQPPSSPSAVRRSSLLARLIGLDAG